MPRPDENEGILSQVTLRLRQAGMHVPSYGNVPGAIQRLLTWLPPGFVAMAEQAALQPSAGAQPPAAVQPPTIPPVGFLPAQPVEVALRPVSMALGDPDAPATARPPIIVRPPSRPPAAQPPGAAHPSTGLPAQRALPTQLMPPGMEQPSSPSSSPPGRSHPQAQAPQPDLDPHRDPAGPQPPAGPQVGDRPRRHLGGQGSKWERLLQHARTVTPIPPHYLRR